MRSISGNVLSDKIPGGSLIAALLDRNLMTWSDRGGASRQFGDRWSEQCTLALEASVGSEVPVPGGASFTLEAVVRLDENPRIAIQASRHKLVNPDFVLYGTDKAGWHVLQSADAKFAVDTINSAQVSADALQALLDVEGGLVGEAIVAKLGSDSFEPLRVARGVFLSPQSPLTDYFLPRVTTGPGATVDPSEVVLLPADPAAMFAGSPLSRLIGVLARIDHLPVSPRNHLLAAMYYFRLASACAWLWVEQHTPLLTLEPRVEPDPGQLLDETTRRARDAATGIALVERWHLDVEAQEQTRRAMRDITAMPVRMRELRELLEQRGKGDERALLKQVRAALERHYRRRLVETVGVIPARPDRPLPQVLDEVATASRQLYPELHALAVQLIEADGDAGTDGGY